jgi:beta-lactamase class A
MRDILGNPELHHKFVAGLEEYRPSSVIFRKSGTWRQWHADAALVERDGTKYVAVALLESPNGQNVLPQLIVRLDDIIYGPARRGPQVTTAAAERAATVSGDLLPARNR